MNRLGWTILVLIVLVTVGFAAMFSDDAGTLPPRPVERGVLLTERIAGLVMPVAGIPRAALTDTWGQARAGGLRRHQAIDIVAPGGTPVVAAADGRVEKLFHSAAGGITAYIRSPDGRWGYYYAHLVGYAPGLAEGRLLRAGETVGYVGDTGNAGAGNTHLHFAISRMPPGARWWQGDPVNPYPLLAGSGGTR